MPRPTRIPVGSPPPAVHVSAAAAARRARLAEVAALREADEALLVRELRAIGYDIASVYDFLRSPVPSSPQDIPRGSYRSAYPVLLRHLTLPHDPVIKEGIVRALTVKDGGSAVEAALLEAFATEPTPLLRWVLANALTVAMPYRRRKAHPEIAAAFRSGGA